MENRLLKGIQYFRNIKPSQQNAASWSYLHKWFDLLEETTKKPLDSEINLQTAAELVFGPVV